MPGSRSIRFFELSAMPFSEVSSPPRTIAYCSANGAQPAGCQH